MSQPIPLNYAAAPPGWKKPMRWIVLGVMLSLVGLVAWRWGPGGYRQCQLLYWQQQCMAFAMPVDAVVYDEDHVAVSDLLSKPGYHPDMFNAGIYVSFNPDCLDRFGGSASFFRSGLRGSPLTDGATVFLHERISSSGHRRLVLVSYQKWSTNPYAYFALTPVVLNPRPVRAQGFDGWHQPRSNSAPQTRIFAGQVDPADAAHFTIRYQMWGQEDVLDGRLLDDDSVSLTPRNTPKSPHY